MEDLVIFSKPIIWILLSVIAAVYVADTLLGIFLKKSRAGVSEAETELEGQQPGQEYYLALLKANKLGMVSHVVAGVNVVLHFGMLAALILIKATLAEALFLIMVSVALALTSNRIKGE